MLADASPEVVDAGDIGAYAPAELDWELRERVGPEVPRPRQRRKGCKWCREGRASPTEDVFGSLPLLQEHLNPVGKILARRYTGACAKHQRQVAKAIKRARHAHWLDLYSDRQTEWDARITAKLAGAPVTTAQGLGRLGFSASELASGFSDADAGAIVIETTDAGKTSA